MTTLPPLPVLPAGRYRHYKGKDYEVAFLARHSETEDVLVVYRPLYGAGEWWVRPFDMFVEKVEVEPGLWRSRFEFVGPV